MPHSLISFALADFLNVSKSIILEVPHVDSTYNLSNEAASLTIGLVMFVLALQIFL